MDNQTKEKRPVVFGGRFRDADYFLTKLIQKAKKQIFITDPMLNSPLLEYLDKSNEKVEIVVACPINQYTIESVNNLSSRVRIIPKADIKDRFLVIDLTSTYIFGFPKDDNGKEYIAITKFIDPFIGNVLVKEFHLDVSR